VKRKAFRILYWLAGIILSLLIIWLIAGRGLADLVTSRGISLYEAGNYDSARKYFRISQRIRSNSDINDLYLVLTAKALGDELSIEAVRALLKSEDEEVVIKALEIVGDEKLEKLLRDVEKLAEEGSEVVSDVADRVLIKIRTVAFRCKACGARYSMKLPQKVKMPYVCKNCRKRTLYPAEYFSLAKMLCNGCGHVFVIERIPGEPLPTFCPRCGSNRAASAHLCHSCGHKWGGSGMVTSCPECKSSRVGAWPVASDEAAEYRRTH
jgi:predicted Zn-ribbon and HTH transcriptional regulator